MGSEKKNRRERVAGRKGMRGVERKIEERKKKRAEGRKEDGAYIDEFHVALPSLVGDTRQVWIPLLTVLAHHLAVVVLPECVTCCHVVVVVVVVAVCGCTMMIRKHHTSMKLTVIYSLTTAPTWFSLRKRSGLLFESMYILARALCVAASMLPSWMRVSNHGNNSFKLQRWSLIISV